MSVRIDKWLHVARIFKTRMQAIRACKLGRVTINGQSAKPHRNLHMEDRIQVQQGEWSRILIVKELRDKPLPRAEARGLYEDISPPRPMPGANEALFSAVREKGRRRPTKKERRQIERLTEL